MLEDVVRNILYGLIASSLMGIVIVIGAQATKTKAENMTGSKAFGIFIYVLLICVWYIGLIWYWFNQLASL